MQQTKFRYYDAVAFKRANPPRSAVHTEFLRTGRIDRSIAWSPSEKRYLSYQEVAEAMASLRGASVGEPGIPTEALEPQLNKIAGKIYYLDRLVSQLGPEAAFLAFESESTDTELERFLASQALGAANGGEAGAVGEKSLTSKLRGFFNI